MGSLRRSSTAVVCSRHPHDHSNAQFSSVQTSSMLTLLQPLHYIQPVHDICSHYTIYAATTLYMQPLHGKLHDCCCSMLLTTDMLLRRQECTNCCICDCSSDPAVLAWDSGSTSISISLYRWTSVGGSAGLSPAASAASCCAACQGSEFAIWATCSACMCRAGSL